MMSDWRDKAGKVLPFSAADSADPEKLWEYLAAYEETTGGSVLAIAHNGNVSNGQMFPLERLNGQPTEPTPRRAAVGNRYTRSPR